MIRLGIRLNTKGVKAQLVNGYPLYIYGGHVYDVTTINARDEYVITTSVLSAIEMIILEFDMILE